METATAVLLAIGFCAGSCFGVIVIGLLRGGCA